LFLVLKDLKMLLGEGSIPVEILVHDDALKRQWLFSLALFLNRYQYLKLHHQR